jgi:carbamoyl-phosphate synthase large subunit
MGVHTGDSITVAPALTLTDKEYQKMRDASIAVLREIGVETGGSNVQFAVNPIDGRLLVIEMNPRVSRSSALASKATGFPIAKVAAKLAVGFTLDEIKNDITGGKTPASFEPTIDYVITKIPKFTFEKFKGAESVLSSSMKSVGEVMAIGRCFAESLQKALRSMESGLSGLDEVRINCEDLDERKKLIKARLKIAEPNRILLIAQAFREGISLEEIKTASGYEPWFLEQIQNLINVEKQVRINGLPENKEEFLALKKLGFSDKRLAKLVGKTEKDLRDLRNKLNVKPVYKRVDSCAGEFDSDTSYMYSCYES